MFWLFYLRSKLNASLNSYKKYKIVMVSKLAKPGKSQLMFHKKSSLNDFIKKDFGSGIFTIFWRSVSL